MLEYLFYIIPILIYIASIWIFYVRANNMLRRMESKWDEVLTVVMFIPIINIIWTLLIWADDKE